MVHVVVYQNKTHTFDDWSDANLFRLHLKADCIECKLLTMSRENFEKNWKKD